MSSSNEINIVLNMGMEEQQALDALNAHLKIPTTDEADASMEHYIISSYDTVEIIKNGQSIKGILVEYKVKVLPYEDVTYVYYNDLTVIHGTSNESLQNPFIFSSNPMQRFGKRVSDNTGLQINVSRNVLFEKNLFKPYEKSPTKTLNNMLIAGGMALANLMRRVEQA